MDNRENPVAGYLTDKTKTEWFGSDKVSTQVEEVDRVKRAVNAKIDALERRPAKQTVEVRPHPDARSPSHNDERRISDRLANVPGDPGGRGRLNKRLHDAFPAAVQAYQTRPDALKFPQAFENACLALGGPPARAFELTFLKLLPAKPEKTFEPRRRRPKKWRRPSRRTPNRKPTTEPRRSCEASAAIQSDAAEPARRPPKNKDTLDEVFQQTLTAVHDQLKGQLDELFDEARTGRSRWAIPATVCATFSTRPSPTCYSTWSGCSARSATRQGRRTRRLTRLLAVVGLTVDCAKSTTQAALLKHIGEELQGDRPLGARRIHGGASGGDRRAARSGRWCSSDSMDLLTKEAGVGRTRDGSSGSGKDDVKQVPRRIGGRPARRRTSK